MELRLGGRRARVLDFDIECRPLSWYGGDWVTKEITAIACKFVGERRKAECWLLGETDPKEILENFVERYDDADLVTGHFIRGFDLPVINAAMVEHALPPLHDKLTQDTKLDLVKRSGRSNSQENLAAELGLSHEKVHMTDADWRDANRLTPSGLVKTRRRCVGDVEQHMEMRARMMELGLLKEPVIWSPTGHGKVRYHA